MTFLCFSNERLFLCKIFWTVDFLAARLLSSCFVFQSWKNQQAASSKLHLFESIMISNWKATRVNYSWWVRHLAPNLRSHGAVLLLIIKSFVIALTILYKQPVLFWTPSACENRKQWTQKLKRKRFSRSSSTVSWHLLFYTVLAVWVLSFGAKTLS